MTTRKELVEAAGTRYRSASVREKTTILDEFVALTGYHRKHAIRVLGGEEHASGPPRRRRNPVYDEAVRQSLPVRLPGYMLFNFRAGLVADSWQATFFIDNLTNRRAELEATPSLLGNVPTYDRIAANRPRTVGVSLSKTY